MDKLLTRAFASLSSSEFLFAFPAKGFTTRLPTDCQHASLARKRDLDLLWKRSRWETDRLGKRLKRLVAGGGFEPPTFGL